MRHRKASLFFGTALTLICAASPPVAWAQQAADGASDSGASKGLDEVVVNAEKLATGRSIQKVPIAVTGIDADAMEALHVENIVDLGHMTPGVTLEPTGTLPGTAAFQIRGVGSRSSTATIDAAVAVTQDGMPLTLQTGVAFLGTFDTQSVEILRGPQGVLQGVNAAGGAVTFSTPLPSSTLHESASVTVGNDNLIGATGIVEGPLADGFLAKLAVSETHVDGYYNNTTGDGTFVVAPGNPSGQAPQHATGLVGGVQSVVIKPTFLIQPTEDIKIKIFAQLENDIDGGSSPIAINPNPYPGPAAKFISAFGYTPRPNGYETNLTTPGFTHITEEHLITELDWNLQAGTWTTIAAYRNVNFNSVFNNAGSPFNIVLVDTTEQNRQANLESRFNGRISEDLSYLAGVYLFEDNLPATVINSTNLAELGKPLAVKSDPNSPLNMENQFAHYNQDTRSAAAFGNLDYTIMPDLTLEAGLRYQYEYKGLDIQPGTNAAGVVYCKVGTLSNCPNTYYDTSKTWYTLTPRGVLSYQITPSLLTYFSYSKGWGAGNYNAGASALSADLTPANPETVNAYEVGLKGQWLDNRLRTNFALYDEEFNQIQRTAVMAVNGAHISSLLNAATATIRGVEAEITAMPVDSLRLNASVGYTMAAYDSFTATLPTNAYAPGLSGTQLAFQTVPKWTTDFSGTYTFGLPRLDGDFDVNADYSWRSKQYGDFFNSPQEVMKSYGLVNASLNYSHGPMSYSLWGRNLQNTFYSETTAITSGWVMYPGMPRTFGLTVSAKL